MKRVLFVQHGDVDKPGLLAEALAESGVGCEVFHAWRDGAFPALEEFHGLALGGGGQSAWEVEKYSYLETERHLVRSAMQRGLPVLGLCLGAQILARAMGAEVRRAERKEIGFFPVELNDAGRADAIVGALPSRFPAAHWHGDVFEIPRDGACLGSSALTPHQILRCGTNAVGFQFHLEMTPALFEELVWDSEDFFRDAGLSPENLIQEAHEVLPGLEPAAREVFRRWAAGL
ncbi:MAG: type 1 glutamine amidotransferase [Spartobacteria bacterium]